MKFGRTALTAAAILSMHPFAALGQDAALPQWLERSIVRRAESLQNVELYIRRSKVEIPGVQMALPGGAVGPCTGSICQAVKIETTDIPGVTIERPLSPMELGVLSGNTSSAFLDAFGQGLIQTQFMINQAFGTQADLFDFLTGADGLGDFVLPALLSPTTMFAAGGRMMLEAADAAAAAEESLRNSSTLAQAEADRLSEMLLRFVDAGEANVGTVNTLVFRADISNMPVQSMGDQSFKPTSASLYIDPESYAFVKQRFEGSMTDGGESQDFFIEVENSDFRNPPGCGDMYEPYRRVMRMGGMLNDEQMAEIEQARAQLAEFEQRIAEMPAQQRAMMERMMKSQLEMMRGLVNGGAIERVEQVEEVLCNPDLASLFGVGAPLDSNAELVRQIQAYLELLGYEPGNTDGVLDEPTRTAISKFQAGQGLSVTGEPSAELLGVLARLVEQ